MIQPVAADSVFYALSHALRREVVERLSAGPATVSELAAPYDLKLPSLLQHLSVLERSHLVTSRKQGRVRTYELVPEPFQAAEEWLSARRRDWEARLDRFDQHVLNLKAQETEP